MEGKKITASKRKDPDSLGISPTIDKQQPRTETRKRKRLRTASESSQPETHDLRSHIDRGNNQDIELDDNDNGNEGNGGSDDTFDEDHRSTHNVTEAAVNARDDDSAASETESFTKTYGHFRFWIRGAAPRKVEEEFVANKRVLANLPTTHSLSVQH